MGASSNDGFELAVHGLNVHDQAFAVAPQSANSPRSMSRAASVAFIPAA